MPIYCHVLMICSSLICFRDELTQCDTFCLVGIILSLPMFSIMYSSNCWRLYVLKGILIPTSRTWSLVLFNELLVTSACTIMHITNLSSLKKARSCGNTSSCVSFLPADPKDRIDVKFISAMSYLVNAVFHLDIWPVLLMPYFLAVGRTFPSFE